eukprot:5780157-Prymnesium_polylepis.1
MRRWGLSCEHRPTPRPTLCWAGAHPPLCRLPNQIHPLLRTPPVRAHACTGRTAPSSCCAKPREA